MTLSQQILWRNVAYFMIFVLLYGGVALVLLGVIPNKTRTYITFYQEGSPRESISSDPSTTKVLFVSSFLWQFPLMLAAFSTRALILVTGTDRYPLLHMFVDTVTMSAILLGLLMGCFLIYTQIYSKNTEEVAEWASMINLMMRVYHMLLAMGMIGARIAAYLNRTFPASVALVGIVLAVIVIIISVLSLVDFERVPALVMNMLEAIAAIITATYMLIRVNAHNHQVAILQSNPSGKIS